MNTTTMNTAKRVITTNTTKAEQANQSRSVKAENNEDDDETTEGWIQKEIPKD